SADAREVLRADPRDGRRYLGRRARRREILPGVTDTANSQPLAGVRVLDCSEGVGGAYCSKLLGDYGAEVVVVERRSGSRLRAKGPRAQSRGDAAHAGLFAWLGSNKTSLAVDEEDRDRRIRMLAPLADVVVV